MNKQLSIVGRVGQATNGRSFGDTGNKVVKFSLAVAELQDNEKESIIWSEVDVWNGQGKRVVESGNKGRELVLVGRLAMNEYTKEKDGTKVLGIQSSREAQILPDLRLQARR